MKRILIAIDGSPTAAHAAEVGIELARAVGGELALIHVVDPADCTIPEGGVPSDELLASAVQDGKWLLRRFVERAGAGPGGVSALEFAEIGKPADRIVGAAREWGADIIVIGSHGRTGVRRVLLGSVAEAVMRHAPCPVLVVRAPG